MKRYPGLGVFALVMAVLAAIVGCGNSTTGVVTTNGTIVGPHVTGPFAGLIDPAYSYMAISAGYEHTCGLDTSGLAYCWGDNTDGDLGNGTMMQSSTPVAVLGGHVFSAISAGYDHTCALGAASGPDSGHLFCWGNNANGQLGIGTPIAFATQPTQVANSNTFTSVSAGNQAACALLNSPQVLCWGYNVPSGALGLGVGTQSPIYSPHPLDLVADPHFSIQEQVFSSVAVSNSSSASDLSHMCSLTHDQTTYCWGNNSYGQLGTGSANGGYSGIGFQPTTVVKDHHFVAVSVGVDYACGIVTDYTYSPLRGYAQVPYCWGANNMGQLGDGTTNESATPVATLKHP